MSVKSLFIISIFIGFGSFSLNAAEGSPVRLPRSRYALQTPAHPIRARTINDFNPKVERAVAIYDKWRLRQNKPRDLSRVACELSQTFDQCSEYEAQLAAHAQRRPAPYKKQSQLVIAHKSLRDLEAERRDVRPKFSLVFGEQKQVPQSSAELNVYKPITV